jgi:endoglucanase
MNEPNQQTPTQWRASAEAAVAAIRSTGSASLITIPGTYWTGCHDWVESGNAAAWAGFWDFDFAFECHQYLDSNFSGTSPYCQPGNGGATTLAAVTQWARNYGAWFFVSETGWSQDPSCPTEGYNEMNFISQNPDVFGGYAYWAGGPWWSPNYMYLIEPQGGFDQPQMTILQDNL